MDANEVLAIKDGVFILTSGIDDLDGEILVAIADDLTEGVFDGRVIGVDEVAIDVLYGKRGFACRGTDVLDEVR